MPKFNSNLILDKFNVLEENKKGKDENGKITNYKLQITTAQT